MTDTTPVLREAARARLPELAAANAELRDLLESLLSSDVVTALGAGSGTVGTDFGMRADPRLATRATELMRDLDARLADLREAKATDS